MREGDSFVVTLQRTFVIADNMPFLSFTYHSIDFDTSDPSAINDAFEVSLVDDEGFNLVHPYRPSRDAYVNFTEELPAALGTETTHVNQAVALDLSQVFAGTTATLTFRLVNNDGDTQTSVRLCSINLPSGDSRPSVTLGLIDDTAPTGPGSDLYRSDRLTNDPRVQGTASDDQGVVKLEASVDAGPFQDITASLTAGQYQLDPGNLLPGPHRISIRATDTALQTSETFLDFQVNHPPVANAGGRRLADEGDTATFNANGSTDVESPLFAYRWTFHDGSTADGPEASRFYPEDGVYAVQLTVTDTAGSQARDTIVVEVRNLPPVVASPGDRDVAVGELLTLQTSFIDPGILDTHTATVSWGDGTTPAEVQEQRGAGTVHATHLYAQPGTYTATLTVMDDEGAKGTTSFGVTVRPRTLTPAAIKDNGEWGYTERGVWQTKTLPGTYKANARLQTPGTGGRSATWTFSVTPGTYEVFASWPAASSNAPDAPYMINDGRTVRGAVRRDQRQMPQDGFYDNTHWRSLGVYRFDNTVASVVLNDTVSGNVLADGILLVRATPQVAAGGERLVPTFALPLTPETLAPIVQEATARWRRVLQDNDRAAILDRVAILVDDLPPGHLGVATTSAITLDTDAAGHGWFVDSTPTDNDEFTSHNGRLMGDGVVARNMDLLSVVTHELGHVLGFDDLEVTEHAHDAMAAILEPGTRLLPTSGTQTTPVNVLNPGGLPRPKFFVLDAGGSTFAYGPHGEEVGSFSWEQSGTGPRGIASNPSGTTLWVLEDPLGRVTVRTPAGIALGTWEALGLSDPVGLALVEEDLWVVDASLRRVLRYGESAEVREGTRIPDGGFSLHADNTHPSDLTTDGIRVWVTDHKRDAVFVYNLEGHYLTHWQLDPSNTEPSGITRSPSGASDLWVVDRRGIVFHYPNGTNESSGLAWADGTFVLAPGNAQPEAIVDPDGSFNIGDTVSGTIATPGQVDNWVFAAMAGQRLFFDVQQAGSFLSGSLGFEIRNPDQSVLFDISSFDRDVFTLLESGTYTVVVSERFSGGGATGNYRFKVWQVPQPVVAPFSIDEVVSGLIDIPGEEDHFTFGGVAGQRLFFDVQQNGTTTSRLAFTLLRPDGSVLFPTSSSDRDVFVLVETGTYKVIVGNAVSPLDAVGNYRFRIWQVPETVVLPFNLNEIVGGRIEIPGEEDHYTFFATAGQQFYLDIRNAGTVGNRLGMRIVQPDGGVLFPTDDDDQGPFLVPQSGTYTVAVGEWTPSLPDVTGDYEFGVFEIIRPGPDGVPDTKGTEFWLAFPGGYHEIFPRDGEVSLLIAAEQETRGQVYMPGLGTFRQFVARPGSVTTLTFPTSVITSDPELRAVDGVENKGIRVTAEKEITVYGMNHVEASTDAYLGLPLDALGTDYLVLAYKNVRPPNDIRAGVLGTQLAVVASADNTQVTITPSVKAGNRAAGVPFTVTLNRGQTYQLRSTEPAPADLTGTVITSTAPVGVYGGHHAANIPFLTPAADFLVEQLPPVDGWGKSFVAMPLATRTGGDTFRFLAQADGTEVRANGSLIATLNRGQVYETILTASVEIIATKPILVGQYQNSSAFDGATGDPDMIVVPPYEQFLANYTVATPTNDIFQANYIDVLVPSAGVGMTTLDGVAIASSQFHRIGTSDFWGTQIPVSKATHQLAGPVPFGTVVYGFASFDSYSYPGGTNSAHVARVASIALRPDTATVALGVEHEVVAVVMDAGGLPLRNVRVDFRVTGPNARMGFVFTDADGEATFRYTGTLPGVDQVTASVGFSHATAGVTWASPAPILLSLLSPVRGSAFDALTTVLVTGRAVAGVPHLPSGQVFPNRVTHVTVNGVPVDSLDGAGSFFARVPVLPGQNSFAFVATDRVGQTATASLTLEGLQRTPGDPPFDLLSDVSASFRAEYSRTSFRAGEHTLYADWAVRNTGQYPSDTPLFVGVTRLSDPRVQVQDADGVTPDGVPYYDFSAQVSGGILTPDGLTGALTLAFFNPEQVPFTYDLVFLGRLNSAPQIETPPPSRPSRGGPTPTPSGQTTRMATPSPSGLQPAPAE